MFNASESLANASISVVLPESVEIVGRPDLHRLSWRADLKQGPNLLQLPLIAVGNGSGTLVIRLAYGSLVRTLEVPITSTLGKSRATGLIPDATSVSS
jgi:hypothetical protein